MSKFTCPVCGLTLDEKERTYKCENNHSFDMAKEGYVNLLMPNKAGGVSGDDALMVASRTRFLDKDFYKPLRDKMCDVIKNTAANTEVLVDAGCGEGYYTKKYMELSHETYGIDISKSAVKHASKKCKNARFAVASVYHMPIADNCADVVVNCFSPNAPDEFRRILKDDGCLLYVVPGARHLWELKSILYDNPYENEEKTTEYDGFVLDRVEKVTTQFDLQQNEDVLALFHMTPYSWNTPEECVKRLENIKSLTVTADFRIHVYKCI